MNRFVLWLLMSSMGFNCTGVAYASTEWQWAVGSVKGLSPMEKVQWAAGCYEAMQELFESHCCEVPATDRNPAGAGTDVVARSEVAQEPACQSRTPLSPREREELRLICAAATARGFVMGEDSQRRENLRSGSAKAGTSIDSFWKGLKYIGLGAILICVLAALGMLMRGLVRMLRP